MRHSFRVFLTIRIRETYRHGIYRLCGMRFYEMKGGTDGAEGESVSVERQCIASDRNVVSQ